MADVSSLILSAVFSNIFSITKLGIFPNYKTVFMQPLKPFALVLAEFSKAENALSSGRLQK